MREVVITGIGAVTPVGIGRSAFWASLLEGRSGVRLCPRVEQWDMPVKIAADVRDFEPKQFVRPRKSLKVMSREIQMAFAASVMAWEDAGLSDESRDPDRTGVVLGSEMFYSEIEDLEDVYRACAVNGKVDLTRWGEQFPSHIFPLWMLKYLPNMPACHMGIYHDARGPNNTITSGEVSSLLAVAEATRTIQRDQADLMLAGGTGNRINLTSLIYRGTELLSRCEERPPTVPRPFDRRRDGIVNGEGAAILILESRQHAEQRGAPILGRILGFAEGFEPGLPAAPRSGRAIRRSIEGALREASLRPQDIDHVSAHGIATVDHDAVEARAIRETLGDVPVTAPKSYWGHLGAGSGAVELAATVLALHHGHVPPTINSDEPDPQCPINLMRSPRPLARHAALVLSQAFMGQAAALAVGRP